MVVVGAAAAAAAAAAGSGAGEVGWVGVGWRRWQQRGGGSRGSSRTSISPPTAIATPNSSIVTCYHLFEGLPLSR